MEELQTLVLRARAGDVEAYCRIVARCQDMAYGYACSILGDFHLAEDAAQEAFVEAYRNLSRLREPGAFPGWLRRIVFKHCDRIVRDRRTPRPSPQAAAGVSAECPTPPEAAERRELARRVLAAIRALPQDQRTVTTLFYIDGYSQAEVAEFLDVPVTTVNNRLHAARRRLKEGMLKMIAKDLQASKPGPDFASRIVEVLRLRKQGREDQARQKYRSALDDLVALQKAGRHLDVVRAHEAMVQAIRRDATYADMWADTYCQFHPSYYAVGKPLEVAEGILSGLPADTPADKAGAVAHLLKAAACAFLEADQPERANAQVRRMLGILEKIEGQPDCRFLRGEALLILYRSALKRGDKARAAEVLEEIRANLSAYEREFASAVERREEWGRWLGDACHNVAHHLAFFGGEFPEGIRLMRRAIELREFAPSHIMLARWVLCSSGDRGAALVHLKKAAGEAQWHELLRREFRKAQEFAPVREDPEFVAVVSPDSGRQ